MAESHTDWLNACAFTIHSPDPQDCGEPVIPDTSFCPKHWAFVAWADKQPQH